MENNINNNSNSKNLGVNREKKEIKRVIKTYRDYAVKALDNKPTSLANMIIQEKKKQSRREKKSIKNPKNIFMMVISAILVILGISVIAVVIIFVDKSGTDSSEKRIISHVESTIEYDYKIIKNHLNLEIFPMLRKHPQIHLITQIFPLEL